MAEITQEEIRQLEQAQTEVDRLSAGGPPVAVQVSAFEAAELTFGTAGCGTAKLLVMNHYFTSSSRTLWAYVDKWRGRGIGNAEEQGLVQIAYASDRVDVCWDGNDKLTTMRCWKYF